jgi:hypothetical protein
MDTESDINSTSNSSSDLMNIKTLEKEYNSVLKQYEEAYKNCNAKLNSMNSADSKIVFTPFPNNSFWGTDKLKEGSVSSQKQCEDMCASEGSACSGATYSPDKKYCWARTGDGPLSVSVNGTSDIALLPNIKACMVTLKSLNKRLLEINQELTSAIANSSPKMETQDSENQQKSEHLHRYYAQLLAERLQMDKMVATNDTINSEYENQTLVVNQSNGSLRFWTVIACVLVIIIFNQMRGKQATFASIFWLLVMISLIVLSFSISTISGFTVWAILILIIILMKMGIIPSPKNDSTD